MGSDSPGVLTISGGLASYPYDGDTVEQLFEKADDALLEAKRLLKPNGRLFVLLDLASEQPTKIQQYLADWGVAAGLRLAPSRFVPKSNPKWLLSVATSLHNETAAA